MSETCELRRSTGRFAGCWEVDRYLYELALLVPDEEAGDPQGIWWAGLLLDPLPPGPAVAAVLKLTARELEYLRHLAAVIVTQDDERNVACMHYGSRREAVCAFDAWHELEERELAYLFGED